MKHLFFILFASVYFFSCTTPVVDPTDPMDPMEEEPGSLKIGLLAHFDFNGHANDVSGGNYSGIIHGATIVPDRNGEPAGAFSFDGDDYIDLGNIQELAFGGFSTYTMTAWVKAADLGANSSSFTVASKFNGGVSAGWYLSINSNSKLKAFRNVVPWSIVSTQDVEREEFVHVAASYDGANFTVYINGEVESSSPFTSQPSDVVTSVLVGAAHDQNNIVPSFKGVIDDLRFYNRVLTDDEFEYLVQN